MSQDLSSLNLTLLKQFLTVSRTTRVGLECEQASVQRYADQVAALCSQPNLGEIVSVPDTKRLLAMWEGNDAAVQAIYDIVEPFTPGGFDQATVPSALIRDAFVEQAAKRPPVIASEPAELVGFPPNSGVVDDPVCAANGNFFHGDRDFITHGFGAVIDTVRLYNSMAANRRGVFGWGWSSMLDMSVRPADETGTVRVTLADGALTVFVPDGEGGFRLDGRRRLRLTTTDDGWTLSHGRDEEWFFDSEGRIVGGRDKLASFAVRQGSRRITVTESRSRRSIVYTLDDEGLVSKARSGDGRTVTYEYDGGGHCLAARRSTGDITYEVEDDLVVAIFDADGVLFCRNTYDLGVAGRVLTQLSAHGRTTVYRYEEGGVTVVGDTDGGPEATFKHDVRGNLKAMSGGHHVEARMAWDCMDRLALQTDRTGNTTRFVYHPDPSLDLLLGRIDPDGHGELLYYDDFGRLVRQTGRNGETHEYFYDTDDRSTPAVIVDPAGGRITTTFGTDGLPETITDADGVTTKFMFDADGQMVATVNGAGDRTIFVYDKVGRLAKVTDPMGKSATFGHEASGRVVEVTSVAGIVHNYVNSAAGRVLSCTTNGMDSWVADYGDHGQPTAITDAVGATFRYDYDTHGSLVKATAPDGSTFRQEFDAELNLVATEDSAGNRATQEFDAEGRSIKVSSADGETWTRTVDNLGRTKKMVATDGSVSSVEYHPGGQAKSLTTPTGETFHFEVDRLGRLTAEIDPDGHRTTYEYTPAGRLLRHTSAAGRQHTFGYDAAGRLSKVVDPDGLNVTAEYRADGQANRISAAGSSVDFEHDDAGRITKWTNSEDIQSPETTWEPNQITSSEADHAMAQFQLDPRGLLASATDAAGVVTDFERDLLGRITGTTTSTADDKAIVKADYAPSGEMSTITDPLSATTTIDRSPSGRPLGVTIANPTGSIGWSYTYDEMRRVTAISSSTGENLAGFEYDELGYQIAAVNAHGRVSIERDRHGRVNAVEGIDGATTRFERDADGVVTRRIEAGASVEYLRTPAGKLIGFEDSEAGIIPIPFTTSEDQTTSAAGRILRDRHGRIFSYDDAGRIAHAVTAAGTQSKFTYNDLGHLATDTTPRHGHRQFRYNIGGQLETVIAADGSTSEFSYDAAGRRTAELRGDGTRVRYYWNELNHLTRVVRTAPDGTESERTIIYSALDRPEQVDDTTIGWDDAVTGKPIRIGEDRYLRKGRFVSRAEPEARWTDGTSDDPWGDTGQTGITLGYRGELTVDNLVFMGARVYDPVTRTFLSRDPLPSVAGANAYHGGYNYAWNDPINYLDPTGHEPVSNEDFDGWKENQERSPFGRIVNAVSSDLLGYGAMALVIVIGVGLCFTPFAPVGAGMLIGVAVSGGIGAATGNFNPRTVAISGAFGALPGGASLSATRAVAMGAASGAAENVAIQVLAEGTDLGDIDVASVVVSAATGGALKGTGRIGGIKGVATTTATAAGGEVANQVIVQDLGLDELNITSIVINGAIAGAGDAAGQYAEALTANTPGKKGTAAPAEAAPSQSAAALTAGTPAKAATAAPPEAAASQATNVNEAKLDFSGAAPPPQVVTPKLLVPEPIQPMLALPAGSPMLALPPGKPMLELSPAGGLNPWPDGANGLAMPAPPGMRIDMVFEPNQPRPGFWGTFDSIETKVDARDKLAILERFKGDVVAVKEYEVPEGMRIQVGHAGPQTENGVTYPGGGTQVHILNYADRDRLVEVPDSKRPLK